MHMDFMVHAAKTVGSGMTKKDGTEVTVTFGETEISGDASSGTRV